jgi:leader peptidase (prepilin peptidase) / N-methyltransferase
VVLEAGHNGRELRLSRDPAVSSSDPDLAAFVAAVAGAFGLVLGSFLNVVLYRVPRGKSIVRPGSACPSCGTPIKWFDNVPVVSWVVLRARCRSCGTGISPIYPAVELATGALFAVLALVFVAR